MEKILIKNASLGATEVDFYFQNDHNATTFLLDPPSMTLEQGEEKVVQCALTYVFVQLVPILFVPVLVRVALLVRV